jgi:hypothetical protein
MTRANDQSIGSLDREEEYGNKYARGEGRNFFNW